MLESIFHQCSLLLIMSLLQAHVNPFLVLLMRFHVIGILLKVKPGVGG